MARRLGAGLMVAAMAGLLVGAAGVRAGPAVTLALAAQPGTVQAGSEVLYTITATNADNQDVAGLAIADTLPSGFTYRPGSASVSVNGTRVGAVEPAVSSRTLTWSNLRLPAARSGSVYGMHTFVQDRCDNSYIAYQLDQVLRAAGPGAYVKQLFYHITADTAGPQGCWVYFVNAAYDRGLIPVVRLEGVHGGSYWVKPQADSPGNYTSIAQAFRRVVAGLPRRENRPLYVEVWNEPNLSGEWSGAPNPAEYGEFLVDVAAAIRELNDPRIVILNGALSPGGDYNNLAFIDAMAAVPGALGAFDVWASHPYPANHPPEYNSHDGTAGYRDLTIDSYTLELERLAAHGRSGLRVLLTETGYALGSNDYGFEGYGPIYEGNRADYIARALRDYWSRWPEVLGVCPYELVDPYAKWSIWDWLYPSGSHHWQFDSVAAIDKRPTLAPSTLVITFRAVAGPQGGTFTSAVAAIAQGATLAAVQGLAPVTVLPSPTPVNMPTPTPGPPPNCPQFLRNGGFEADSDWTPMGGIPGGYSTQEAHTGARSLRLGLEGGTPVYSFSSAEEELSLPTSPGVAKLSLWYKVASSDPAGDQAYVLVRDANQAFHKLGDLDLKAQGWAYASFDTTGYLGQAVAVRLTVVNDKGGGTTAVYIDDATWTLCSGSSASPTPTPAPSVTASSAPPATLTPTPTPRPLATATPTVTVDPAQIGCVEGLRDSGFEAGDGWTILDTRYRADYVSQPVHSGRRALRVGIASGADVASYSSAEQAVTIPADASAARLSFWCYPQSADRDGGDLQYLLLLDEGGGSTSLMWELSNAPGWQRREFSLDAYLGQRVILRFGARNDGDGALTAMYVDDVRLALCVGVTPTPEPTSTPTVAVPAPGYEHASHLPLVVKGEGEAVVEAPSAAVAMVGHAADGEVRYRSVASDPESGQVYAVADDGVWALAPDGRAPARQLLAGRGYQAAFADLAQRQLLVSDGEAGAVVALDLADGRQVAEAAGLLRPSGIAVYGDRIFVAETGADRVVVLDRRTCGIMRSEPVGAAPYALAVDAARARVWVANAGGRTVTVLDAHTGVPIGAVSLGGLGHPQGIAVDSRRGRVYVTYLVAPRYHGLAVIHAQSFRVERLLRGDEAQPLVGAYGVAVEPASGRIFLSDVGGLLALDPETLKARTLVADAGFVPPFGMVADGASGRLLAADGRRPAVRIVPTR